jgi:hypothetical protein
LEGRDESVRRAVRRTLHARSGLTGLRCSKRLAHEKTDKSVVPATLAVLLLSFGVREPERHQERKNTNPIRRENIMRLNASYWWVVVVGAVFTLARFSEAFLVLRAQQGGIPVALVPLVMVAMNLVYAGAAYPFGKLSDRMSHKTLLA